MKTNLLKRMILGAPLKLSCNNHNFDDCARKAVRQKLGEKINSVCKITNLYRFLNKSGNI
jgi:hypothetical protein